MFIEMTKMCHRKKLAKKDQVKSADSRSDEKFAHEDAERPVVDGPVVAFVQDDFRRYVFWSSTKRPSSTPLRHELRKTEIDLELKKKI
jgi:hypothetical protein